MPEFAVAEGCKHKEIHYKKMLALTIKQPWAWAIFSAGKDVENRDWKTNFRGQVAIHTSKTYDETEFEFFQEFCRDKGFEQTKYVPFVYGAIIGTVEIVDCVTSSTSPWFVGDYGFVLRNPRLLKEPIFCRGALGFWDTKKQPDCDFIIF